MKLFFRIACLLFLLTGALTQDLDLADALDDDAPKPKATDPPKKKDDFELDLSDALGGDDPPRVTPKPAKPPVVVPPKSGGGGGGFGDSDLSDVAGGNYEPEGGKSGGRGMDPGYDTNNAGDQPQDADFEWGHILKMLNANIPEEFFMWMANAKQTLSPLLERVMDLLNALPGNEKEN